MKYITLFLFFCFVICAPVNVLLNWLAPNSFYVKIVHPILGFSFLMASCVCAHIEGKRDERLKAELKDGILEDLEL